MANVMAAVEVMSMVVKVISTVNALVLVVAIEMRQVS